MSDCDPDDDYERMQRQAEKGGYTRSFRQSIRDNGRGGPGMDSFITQMIYAGPVTRANPLLGPGDTSLRPFLLQQAPQILRLLADQNPVPQTSGTYSLAIFESPAGLVVVEDKLVAVYKEVAKSLLPRALAEKMADSIGAFTEAGPSVFVEALKRMHSCIQLADRLHSSVVADAVRGTDGGSFDGYTQVNKLVKVADNLVEGIGIGLGLVAHVRKYRGTYCKPRDADAILSFLGCGICIFETFYGFDRFFEIVCEVQKQRVADVMRPGLWQNFFGKSRWAATEWENQQRGLLERLFPGSSIPRRGKDDPFEFLRGEFDTIIIIDSEDSSVTEKSPDTSAS